MKKWRHRLNIREAGLSLVETIIAMAIMAFLMLSISNVLIKNNVTTASMSTRIKEATEVQALIDDIRQDLLKGAYISEDSYDLRLDYTIPDSDGNALRKIYRITTVSGKQYLQLSKDGGSTWISPYRVSAYNKYQVGSLAKFLYAALDNSCTQFTDVDSDGNIDEDMDGISDVRVAITCTSQPSQMWKILPNATVSSGVVLRNFRFTTGTGSPESIYPLPYTSTGTEWNNATMSWIASMDNSDVFLKVNPALVRSTVAPVSPLIKNPTVLQSFRTDTDNSMYGAAFSISALSWDPSRRRLIIVGGDNLGFNNKIFQADRNGVLIGEKLGLELADTSISLDSLAVEGSSNIILAANVNQSKLYRYNLNSPAPLVPLSTVDLPSIYPYSIAYDSSTPDDFYTTEKDTTWKIRQRNKYTGALVNTWNTGISGTFTGLITMFIEPLTGDFLVVNPYVGSNPANFKMLRVNRTTGTVTNYMTINANTEFGMNASQTYAKWSMAYDPVLNRLFLTDAYSSSNGVPNKVFEILPDKLITAR